MTEPKAPKVEPQPIFMKCHNAKCDSIQAVEIPYAAGTRLYRCVKCKNSFAIRVGGKMDIRHL